MIYALETVAAPWAVNTLVILIGVALVLCAIMVILEIILNWWWFS